MICDDGCSELTLVRSRNNRTDHQSLSYSDRQWSRPPCGCTFPYCYNLSAVCRRPFQLLLAVAVPTAFVEEASAEVGLSSFELSQIVVEVNKGYSLVRTAEAASRAVTTVLYVPLTLLGFADH